MISIIIPVFNMQDYLAETIESAWQAKSKGITFEILVVDDGSTDDSLRIAKRYPVEVISQTNRGLASARNTGIMNASGDWCLFLDADDMLLEKALIRISQAIIEYPDADVIAPSLKTFGTSNQEIILMPNPKLEDFRNGNKIGYCAAIRKSKLLEIGGYSPRMVEGYEDLHLWINLLSRGAKIITIPEVLWLYRTKVESMWTKAKEHHNKLLGIINHDFPEAKLKF